MKRVGRPPAVNPRRVGLRVMLTEGERSAVGREAKAAGLSLSDWVRGRLGFWEGGGQGGSGGLVYPGGRTTAGAAHARHGSGSSEVAAGEPQARPHRLPGVAEVVDSRLAKLFASGQVGRGLGEAAGGPLAALEEGTAVYPVEASPPGGGDHLAEGGRGVEAGAVEPEVAVVVPAKLRQRIVATRAANPGMGVEEFVRRFEGQVAGSGAAVRQVLREEGLGE